MPRKKPVPPKKRRTREHVIADLSANHVERQALLCGYAVERRAHDYGIDLVITTYDREGNVENGEILYGRAGFGCTARPHGACPRGTMTDRQSRCFPWFSATTGLVPVER